jgi:alpha-tubulin suppressor-like RCC1 family protein
MPSLVPQRLALVAILTAVAGTLACREAAGPTSPGEPAAAVQAARGIPFLRVSAGESHTCAIANGGDVLCWGYNGGGQLGIGTDLGPENCEGSPCSTRPVIVAGGLTFRQISAGGRFHTCAVATDNQAYCWGLNQLGQLGNGTETDSFEPTPVAGGLRWLQVSAGINHTCGITLDDVAYCWGHYQAGRLGSETQLPSLVPVKVARRIAWRSVSAGDQFTCGVASDLRAFCWGENTAGQLGIGDATGPESCFTGDNSVPCSTTPLRVRRALSWDQVAASSSHACGVTLERIAYCWGSGALGQRATAELGECVSDMSGAFPCSTKPVRVAGRLAIRQISTGDSHTCALTTDQRAYCWGSNTIGQLGAGFSFTGPDACDKSTCSTVPIAVLGGLVFRDLDAGSQHTCAVTTAGDVFCWGANERGQLGDGTTDRRVRPRRVVTGG